jgi:hypothetical protein
MATHRYIQCAFWTDPFILALTPEEKYFYIYIMTNPHTKQCGCYELPKQLMQLETGYNQDTLTKLINRFISYDKIEYCEETNEIFIKNWLKFNSPNSIPVIKCIQRELSTIKNIDFKRKIIEILHKKGYALDTPSIPSTYTTIKELKELKEKELNASRQEIESQQQSEKEHQPLFNKIPKPEIKKKTKLNRDELEIEISELIKAIDDCKQKGKKELATDLEDKLKILQIELNT